MSLRAHCFWELIFRGERGLFVCRLKETVAAAPKQLMARVLVLSLSHSHWGRAPDGLAWPQAPGQGLLWWPAPGVTSLLPPASPPRSVALDCTHICSIDYTVVLGLGELLEVFHKRGATLALIDGATSLTFHFHALEEEMATHSSALAWRIPGMGEPGGLPSMGSHRVGHG